MHDKWCISSQRRGWCKNSTSWPAGEAECGWSGSSSAPSRAWTRTWRRSSTPTALGDGGCGRWREKSSGEVCMRRRGIWESKQKKERSSWVEISCDVWEKELVKKRSENTWSQLKMNPTQPLLQFEIWFYTNKSFPFPHFFQFCYSEWMRRVVVHSVLDVVRILHQSDALYTVYPFFELYKYSWLLFLYLIVMKLWKMCE